MDADELVVWRCRRVSGRSAWRKHVARSQKSAVPEQKSAAESGRITPLKVPAPASDNGPGDGRETESPQ